MTKRELIQKLQVAKNNHIRWVNLAQLLIKGASLNKKDIVLDAKECSFSKWLETNKKFLLELPNSPSEFINEIEKLHQELHQKYNEIYSIYFSKDKELSFFSKLIGKKKSFTKEETIDASKALEELEEISTKLIYKLEQLEKSISVVPQVAFA